MLIFPLPQEPCSLPPLLRLLIPQLLLPLKHRTSAQKPLRVAKLQATSSLPPNRAPVQFYQKAQQSFLHLPESFYPPTFSVIPQKLFTTFLFFITNCLEYSRQTTQNSIKRTHNSHDGGINTSNYLRTKHRHSW